MVEHILDGAWSHLDRAVELENEPMGEASRTHSLIAIGQVLVTIAERYIALTQDAVDEVNGDAAPSASPDLDREKFHACLHCGWRGRRYAVEAKLLAKRCPECGQPVWEETVGITRAADDAGADEHDWSPWHDVGNGTERRMCVTWDCFAQEFRQAATGPGADAGEVPATRHNRARDPAVRSSDDVTAGLPESSYESYDAAFEAGYRSAIKANPNRVSPSAVPAAERTITRVVDALRNIIANQDWLITSEESPSRDAIMVRAEDALSVYDANTPSTADGDAT